MYLTMLCLGELSVAMPEAGSFQSYASKFISPVLVLLSVGCIG